MDAGNKADHWGDETWETIDAILSVFETGKIPSPEAYATCTILKDGAGISYGIHQATDKGGNLDLIVQRYVDAGGQFADALEPHLPRLARNETATAAAGTTAAQPWVKDLMSLLVRAGREDAVMRRVQDAVFRERYRIPAQAAAKAAGLVLPLSAAVVYDTHIQSGPNGKVFTAIRQHFAELPPSRGGDERAWTRAYAKARRAWLAGFHSGNPAKDAEVAKTVYRMDTFLALMDAGNWGLVRPFKVLGVRV